MVSETAYVNFSIRDSHIMSTMGCGTRKHFKKEKNPFSLPSDGAFLAYYNYLNTAEISQELKKISRNELCGYSPEEKAKAIEARKLDTKANLIKELTTKGLGSSFSKIRYVQDIRLLCKLRLLVGKKRDGCILLDQKLDMEQRKFQNIKQQYKECVSALEQFLAYDHEESMNALSRANAAVSRTTEMSNRRDELLHLCGRARLEVYQWEEIWRTVKACHRFLHKVSPLVFTELSEDSASNEAPTIPAKRKDSTKHSSAKLGNASSLESLIATFEKEASDLSSSEFKNPMDLGLLNAEDILQAFREIELQNLNALIHLESLGGPMTEMISRIDVAEVSVKHEIDNVLGDIQYLEAEIEREEMRAKLLEQHSDDLIGESFRELITSQKILEVRILVEDAYESCVAKNESGLEPLAMACALESAYERLSSELDTLPRHLVVECEREGFRKEIRETREAEEAANKFELMHRLLVAVKRLMEPSEPKRRVLMKRSVPIESKMKNDKSVALENEKPSVNFFGKDCKSKKHQNNESTNKENEDDNKH